MHIGLQNKNNNSFIEINNFIWTNEPPYQWSFRLMGLQNIDQSLDDSRLVFNGHTSSFNKRIVSSCGKQNFFNFSA